MDGVINAAAPSGLTESITQAAGHWIGAAVGWCADLLWTLLAAVAVGAWGAFGVDLHGAGAAVLGLAVVSPLLVPGGVLWAVFGGHFTGLLTAVAGIAGCGYVHGVGTGSF